MQMERNMSDKQDTSKMVWYQQGNRKAMSITN